MNNDKKILNAYNCDSDFIKSLNGEIDINIILNKYYDITITDTIIMKKLSDKCAVLSEGVLFDLMDYDSEDDDEDIYETINTYADLVQSEYKLIINKKPRVIASGVKRVKKEKTPSAITCLDFNNLIMEQIWGKKYDNNDAYTNPSIEESKSMKTSDRNNYREKGITKYDSDRIKNGGLWGEFKRLSDSIASQSESVCDNHKQKISTGKTDKREINSKLTQERFSEWVKSYNFGVKKLNSIMTKIDKYESKQTKKSGIETTIPSQLYIKMKETFAIINNVGGQFANTKGNKSHLRRECFNDFRKNASEDLERLKEGANFSAVYVKTNKHSDNTELESDFEWCDESESVSE